MTTYDIKRYPDYWKTISQQDYEKRFNQRYELDDPENVIGYGVNNPYLPPLNMPTWLLSVLDRHLLLSMSLLIYVSIQGFNAFWVGLGNGDTWDGFWYNNPAAAGSQIYPTGLSKYYDMYSMTGFVNYISGWIWIWVCNFLTPFTFFIPFDLWEAAINGYKWDKIWTIMLPWPLLMLF